MIPCVLPLLQTVITDEVLSMHTAAALTEEGESLSLHVSVCAERYAHLNFRLLRLERLVMMSSSTLFAGMVTLIVTLLLERG
jgi:hypothetical protein